MKKRFGMRTYVQKIVEKIYEFDISTSKPGSKIYKKEI